MKKLHLAIILFTLSISSVFSQAPSEVIRNKLITAGFENIRVDIDKNNYTISFENNIYRWNVRALSTALDTISRYASEHASLNVLLLRFGQPQIVTKVDASKWITFRNDTIENGSIDSTLTISYKTKVDWDRIRHSIPVNRNTVKFDFVFYPQFYIANLTFSTIYKIQFNIAPALEVSFWKGMLFTAQVVLPIYSDSRVYGEEGNKVRPGFIVLSQDFRLNGPWFGNVSIGNFNNHRYGLDVSIRHPFKNPRWDIGFNAGFTGFSVITDEGWELGELNTFTFSLSAGYFLPRFNLQGNVSAGRFLHGDYGVRFDLTRMFGETAIGFYAAYSILEPDIGGQPNFGFHFAIPFPPGKRFKHKTVRVNLPHYFDWEYNGATDFLYNRYYERRPNENRSEHYFNPLYIKNELLKNRHF